MGMRYMTIGIVAAGLLAGTLALAAQDTPQAPAGRRLAVTPLGRLITGHLGRLVELRGQLDLTDDQRQQIRAAVQSHRPQIAEAAKAVVAGKRSLQEQVAAEAVDEKAIRAAAADLGKAIGDAAVVGAKIRAEVAPILTDEQKQLLKQFHADKADAVDQWLEEIHP